MGYQQYPNMMCALPNAMSQMNIGGIPTAISPRRDSFGTSGPGQMGVRASFAPPHGYYVIPTSPPTVSIESSPNHHLMCKSEFLTFGQD